MSLHILLIIFLFALGACIGSFLNVVVWRLPRDESVVSPPSHCPKCNRQLAWYDNVPILGWLALRGRCRYCGESISPRYPIVEAVTGVLFAFYYAMFFLAQRGPCNWLSPRPLIVQLDWPIYGLYVFLIACLLAASLIDAELFIIPIEIPWIAAGVGVIAHTLMPIYTAGALHVGWVGASVGIGGGAGLIISFLLYRFGVIGQSFPKGEPLLEVDREQLALELEEARRKGEALNVDDELPPAYTRGQIRLEIGKEMLFLLPPLIGAIASLLVVARHSLEFEAFLAGNMWFDRFLGSVLGALVGGFVVWITRILGTLAFGRVAMGLGDVHLMFGVGAIIGAGAATVAFFIAPFFGILIAIWMLLTGTRRELPYGPYLSVATGFVMLFYCPIADYLRPGMIGLVEIVRARLGY